MCRISFKTAQLEAELGRTSEEGDYRGCIAKSQKETQPALKRAINAMSKKPATVAAIKAYYAAWVGTIRGISPGSDEVRISYATRQKQSEQRLNELWAAVELEAGL